MSRPRFWCLCLRGGTRPPGPPQPASGINHKLSLLAISDRTKESIRGGRGADPDRHPSRSEAAWRALRDLVEAGCCDADIAAIFLDPANTDGEKARKPGRRWLAGEIALAPREPVDAGTIRVIDIVFVLKDAVGLVTTREIRDLGDDSYSVFDPVVSEVSGLLSDDDVTSIMASLENNSSAGVMLFKNTWATRFRNAIVNANDEVVVNERIPRIVIKEREALNAPVSPRVTAMAEDAGSSEASERTRCLDDDHELARDIAQV